MGDLYAKAGEIVTCENGHEIATVRQDIFRYTRAKRDQFSWREGAEPELCTPYSANVCPHCGGRYIAVNAVKGTVMHFAEGGWRGSSLGEFGVKVA